MLIQFSVENFLSIRDKATLSLVKGTGSELVGTNVLDSDAPSTPSLLVSAAIYGPNGAGKTNMIRAIQAMQNFISGSPQSQPGVPISVTPFRLDERYLDLPTQFEMDFVVEAVRYQYGFSRTAERVWEEWLFAYPKGRPRRLIERSYSVEKNAYEWGTMDKLAGQKQVWQDATRSDALFLSTAVQLNCTQLLPIYNWFRTELHIVGLDGWTGAFSAKECENEDSKKRIEQLLRIADTGIEGIEVEQEALDWLGAIHFESAGRYWEGYLKTIHLTDTGLPVKFDFQDESDGTRKLFRMAGPWLKVLKDGEVLIVDELNDNLHSHMVAQLVQLFHNKLVNTKGAQIIFTTHDTSLLNKDVFRRDQIWLCEKNDLKSSVLYSLTEFSPRKGVENIERGYLTGRYGALPNIYGLAEALVE